MPLCRDLCGEPDDDHNKYDHCDDNNHDHNCYYDCSTSLR
jgi:hypothetical protein